MWPHFLDLHTFLKLSAHQSSSQLRTKLIHSSTHFSIMKLLLGLALVCTLLQEGISLPCPRITAPQNVSEQDMRTALLAANCREDLNELLQKFYHPIRSCKLLPEGSQSGYYFLLNSAGVVNLEYCDTTGRCGNQECTGGWMRVAHLDMNDCNQHCPDSLSETSDRRCVRKSVAKGCDSVVYPTHGHEYSRVCGKINAYQHSHPSAFRPYILRKPVTTLEDNYVDGVSLTHGPVSARQHIWTFAAAYSDNSMQCSCGAQPDPDLVPPFVGQDFFCETASRTGYEEITFEEDPLWDGEGCDSQTECCGFNNPPWFCKELPQSTTDDIEMRLCLNEHPDYGNVLIELVDIFVQ